MSMQKEMVLGDATVVEVKKQWWFKVNTKIIRKGPLDGAIFPHVIKVEYKVNGVTYAQKKWISAGAYCPSVGDTVKVYYRHDNPKKGTIVVN